MSATQLANTVTTAKWFTFFILPVKGPCQGAIARPTPTRDALTLAAVPWTVALAARLQSAQHLSVVLLLWYSRAPRAALPWTPPHLSVLVDLALAKPSLRQQPAQRSLAHLDQFPASILLKNGVTLVMGIDCVRGTPYRGAVLLGVGRAHARLGKRGRISSGNNARQRRALPPGRAPREGGLRSLWGEVALWHAWSTRT